MFVGYSPAIKGYWLLNQISQRMLQSRDAVFLEDQCMRDDDQGEGKCGKLC